MKGREGGLTGVWLAALSAGVAWLIFKVERNDNALWNITSRVVETVNRHTSELNDVDIRLYDHLCDHGPMPTRDYSTEVHH